MFIKRIICQVDQDQKKAFSKAQEQWANIRNTKGFMGQIGGWQVKNEPTAMIMSFWENSNTYEFFMKHIHDTITLQNKQNAYYNTITTSFYEGLQTTLEDKNNFKNSLIHAKVLKTTDIFLKKSIDEIFTKTTLIKNLKENYLPYLIISKNIKNPKSLFILSLLENLDAKHENRYIKSLSYELKGFIENIKKESIILEKNWLII
jgi:diacylglycerol kinase